MEIPEKLKAFSEEELALIVNTLDKKGIIAEWEEPLISYYMEVKSWGPSCVNYIREFGKNDYQIKLSQNSTGTDRVLYDPARYTPEQVTEYMDAPNS